jgi:Amt family ammonium transporter
MSDCELNDGDIAMMMAATAFVMLQTPAMGIAQAGMIRRKNSLSMLMQTLSGLVFGSILWFAFGFSLTFGKSINGFIGGGNYMFLQGIAADTCMPDFSTTIPGLLYVSFQMMFAVMVPVIVTGAWAEKMTFQAFIVFVLLWPILVYYPIAHWVWNPEGWLMKMGVMDFAGGITIHTSSGCAAFVAASYLQRREKLGSRPQHHNMPLSILGGALIWAGWYSFNGGSALKANVQAAVALLNTHLGGCAGAFVWTILAYHRDKHWHLSEIIGGAYAGLGAVTPGSGYVSPGSAFIIGIIGGVASFYSVPLIKDKLKIDDVLDVTSLQGVAGMVGSLCVGIFADSRYQADNPGVDGLLISGSWHLLGLQVFAEVVVIAWTVTFTNFIFLLMPRFFNPDVSAYVDDVGLDVDQIGESAYDEDLNLLHDIGLEGMTERLCEAAAKGEALEVRKLLFAGADVEGQDYDGRAPIALAASEGHLHIVKYLCDQHGASLGVRDRYNNTPLDDAMSHGHSHTVNWLLARDAPTGRNAESTGNGDEYAAAYDIFAATINENAAKLSYLLEHSGADPNITDYDGRTPMHLACAEGRPASIQQLLSAGAKADVVDRWGLSPADEAKTGGHMACLRLVVSATSASKSTSDSIPENSTVNYGSLSLSRVPNGGSVEAVSVNVKSPLLPTTSISTTGNSSTRDSSTTRDSTPVDRVSMSTGSSAGVRALCAAARANDVGEIMRVMKKEPDAGAGADYDLRTALHVSASEGNVEAVLELLTYSSVKVNVCDRWKRTPLQDAVDFKHFAVVSILRDHGASMVDEALAFRLCMAASKGDLAFIKKQVDAGKDVSVSDYDGRTALHLAASEGKLEIVEYLVNKIAIRPDPVDRFGNIPLADATTSEIKRILGAEAV